ncbi:type II secretion system protein [Oceanobacillus indicireducens]|uniref:Uncharacterized protein n=1 Tax=Oceanobacillus indicireducens TaxID=1004261 RepID=A0A917Y3R1_9BACI|nr:type II secretion system protein [Oceanobacillus indicireducens]GGN63895.1 hypothetical protein GCM10007971_31210 [Oceanobacillus indicireducens]
MKKKNGYSMIEVLIASSIFFQALILFIPIYADIQLAYDTLRDKRWAANQLQTELQQYIWGKPPPLPAVLETTRNDTLFHFEFNKEDIYMKGCVSWQNAKESEETICLFALRKE